MMTPRISVWNRDLCRTLVQGGSASTIRSITGGFYRVVTICFGFLSFEMYHVTKFPGKWRFLSALPSLCVGQAKLLEIQMST